MALKLFWWNEQPNFGDRISRDIVAYVSGGEVEWAKPAKAELIGLGSIMFAARRSFKSGSDVNPWIWGTGVMKPLPMDFIDHVRVAAVRGPISRELIGAKTEVFGDPGLLMPFVLGEKIARTDKIGVIPHFAQLDATKARLADLGDAIEIIDPQTEDHLDVVRRIAQCRMVFSSSLHGLIVADAYGVPNVWLDPEGNHPYARMKFYDYAAGIGRVMPLPVPVSAIAAMLDGDVPEMPYMEGVRRAQQGLIDSFPAELKAETAPTTQDAFDMEVAG